MSRQAVDLREAGHLPLAQVGNKAFVLAQLLSNGINVPPGVVLTTAAQAAFLNNPDELDDILTCAWSQPSLTNRTAQPLAVRSSGIAEDGEHASFAGQYHTTLGLRGPDQLRAAVLRAWTHASKDAASYARWHGLSDASRCALLIQHVPDIHVAGVCFSCEPRSGSRDKIFIEAARGLGVTVVEGRSVPEQYVIDRDTGMVVGFRQGDQRHAVSLAEGEGTVTTTLNADELYRPCLRDESLRALVVILLQVEALLGEGQDLEWALQEGPDGLNIFVLQARPITGLPTKGPEPKSTISDFLRYLHSVKR